MTSVNMSMRFIDYLRAYNGSFGGFERVRSTYSGIGEFVCLHKISIGRMLL